jgi:CheY-like chemotaxis protein
MKPLDDVLEAHGEEAMSTAAAVECARQYLPNLNSKGFGAARRVRAWTPRGSSRPIAATRQIPVIAVTAFAMAGDERRTLDHGCMPKPIRKNLPQPDCQLNRRGRRPPDRHDATNRRLLYRVRVPLWRTREDRARATQDAWCWALW